MAGVHDLLAQQVIRQRAAHSLPLVATRLIGLAPTGQIYILHDGQNLTIQDSMLV